MPAASINRHLALFLAALLLLGLLIAPTQTALAGSQVTLSETTLTFRGRLTDPVQRTFTLTVTSDPLRNLEIIRHDLLDTRTGAVILSTNITVDPATVAEVSGQARFAVTVSGAVAAGHYTGALELRYDGQPIAAPLTINLDVTFESIPSVDVDANGKNLTLFVRPPIYELPYISRPTSAPSGPTSAEAAVYLVQSGQGEATVEEARVLTMRGAKGQTLPADTVTVTTPLPFTLTDSDAAPLQIVVAGKFLEAGEYSGTLLVRVRNQAAPIQIPITIQIKHGPLVPLLVLVIGLLVAGFLGWWNGKGKLLQETVKPIQRLADDIRGKKRKLQAEERDEALDRLRETFRAIDAGYPAGEVKKLYEAAQAYVSEKGAAADKFLDEALQPVLAKARGVAHGRQVREQLVNRLERMQQRVNDGDYRRLEEVASQLQEMEDKVGALVEVDSFFDSVPADQRSELAQKLDQVATLTEMRSILKNAGVDVPPRAGVSFALSAEPKRAVARADNFELSLKRRLQLSGGALLVTLVLYLFALTVGWISLYANAPTFGADPQQYISLFLWGATIETVRGQTINLISLETVIKT